MKMEKEILTPGQKAVIDGYLQNYEPSETYDSETCMLIDTRTIIDDLTQMCDFDQNSLADYLATLGYKFYILTEDGISGWILKEKTQS